MTVGVVVLALAGCRSQPEWNPVPLPVAEVTTSASPTTLPVPSSSSAPRVIVLPDAGVSSCVNAIQFGAFSGDEELTTMWTSVDADADAARALCRDLAADDPARFDELRRGWDTVQSLTASTPAPQAVDAVLVAACVKRIEWGRIADDPIYLRVWADLGSGSEFVNQACATLALEDPVLVREMADEVVAIEEFLASVPTTG